MGKIAGKNVDYNDFIAKYNVAVANFEQGGQKVDDQSETNFNWPGMERLISDRVLKVAYKL